MSEKRLRMDVGSQGDEGEVLGRGCRDGGRWHI